MNEYILCHYGEIALKGGNRKYFEDKLILNIKNQLQTFSPGSFEYVKKLPGSILIKLNKKGIKEKEKIENALNHTFGIVNYSFCTNTDQHFEDICDCCWNLIKPQAEANSFNTFRITVQRSNKKFSMTSEEAERKIGAFIFNNLKGKKRVSLKNFDLNCTVEIINDLALVHLKKIKGLGGLPVGTGGKAIVMISGGFDSPVAAWYLLKRGVQLRFVHFHSIPYTSKVSLEKVRDLIEVLKKYGSCDKLYSIAFADIQKEIMMKCPEKLRVIMYRRMMIKISEVLAKKEKCLALISGDSLGQVASQTIENINVINNAAKLPIFRPLIGMDKEEIMQIAKEIDTYEISKLPHDDCCTRLMPKNPETKAKLKEVLEAEKNLDVEKLIEKALEKQLQSSIQNSTT